MTVSCFDGVTEVSSVSDLLDYRSWLEGVFQANPEDISPDEQRKGLVST